jgi:hypothetical protein
MRKVVEETGEHLPLVGLDQPVEVAMILEATLVVVVVVVVALTICEPCRTSVE